MKKRFEVFFALILLCGARFVAASQEVKQPVEHLFLHVTLGPQFQRPVSGRLLLFVHPGHGDNRADMDMMSPAATYIAAKEIPFLAPGQTIEFDRSLSFRGAHPTSLPLLQSEESQLSCNKDPRNLPSQNMPLVHLAPMESEHMG